MQFMDHVYDDKVKVPTGTRKVFIVGYGPPASGKSRIITSLNNSALPEELKHVTDRNTIKMDVDKVFQGETSPLYFGKEKKLVEQDTRLSSDVPTRNARMYSTYRHIADQLNDAVYWKSLALGYNIYFETTGWSVKWLNKFIDNSHEAGYTCVVCYPYVDTPNLVKRVLARSSQIGRSTDDIQDSVSRSQNNLKKIALDSENFGDRVIVFDNRASSSDPAHCQMPILYCGNANDKELQQRLARGWHN